MLVPSTLLVLFSTAFCFSARAETLDFRDSDKQLHLIASYAMNTTFLVVVPKTLPHRRLLAAGASLAVGVAKELTDPVFSNADLAADAIGIAMSTVFSFTFDF